MMPGRVVLFPGVTDVPKPRVRRFSVEIKARRLAQISAGAAAIVEQLIDGMLAKAAERQALTAGRAVDGKEPA
jgi:hypothetical protein